MGLKLDIDELVVHGVSGQESERLIAVIELELEAMLSGEGAVDGLVEGGTRSDVAVETPANLAVGDLGKRVAQTIYQSIRGTPVPATRAEMVPIVNSETADSASTGATGRVE